MSSVKCKSGLRGWRLRLTKVYASFEEFKQYCSIYGNHTRLGFETPEDAWTSNPLVEGSVDPSDYRVV